MESMELDNHGDDVTTMKSDSSDNSNISTPDDCIMEAENEAVDTDDDQDDKDESEVRQLESLLTTNPYDYNTHVTLITKVKAMGELNKLRLARENMSNIYPLSPELWLSWLRDEIKLATSPEERSPIVILFERAIKDYLSVEIWLEYLQFSIGSMGDDVVTAAADIRILFERALTSTGLHVSKGAIIWEAFREFENVLVSLVADDEQKKQQIDRVGNLFRRQLACPLINMDKTYIEYTAWRADQGKNYSITETIIDDSYKRATAQLNCRLIYENELELEANDDVIFKYYKEYLDFEKKNGDPGRVIVLYERACAHVSLESELWEDYLSYVSSTIKNETILVPLFERATKNVPWCWKIWQQWMRHMEKWNKPLLEIQQLLEKAIIAGLPTAEDYKNIWMEFLGYLRRRLDVNDDNEREKQLEIIRQAFNRACEHLAKSFGLYGDPQCTVLQFWARIEAIHANDMEKARTLWADILSQGHSTAAASWLEYISIERCYGDTKHLRKLFQRALIAVKDWPESICNAWIEFERDEGTLEQMEACELKTKERMEKVIEERKAKLLKQPVQQEVKKTMKRKADDTGKWAKLGPTSSKQLENEKLRMKNVEKNNEENKTMQTCDRTGEEKTEDFQEVDEKITIFVSNLDYTATEEEIREALVPAGTITLFRMVKDFKGRSKGFCYVQLSSPVSYLFY